MTRHENTYILAFASLKHLLCFMELDSLTICFIDVVIWSFKVICLRSMRNMYLLKFVIAKLLPLRQNSSSPGLKNVSSKLSPCLWVKYSMY